MVLVLGSCGSSKKIAYFQNADSLRCAASAGLFDAKIKIGRASCRERVSWTV